MELIRNNEEIFTIVYCFIILYVNISYLKEHKDIKKGLEEISSEDEVKINIDSMIVTLLALVFNFFRRWLIYLLAVLMTDNIVLLIISVILFVIGLYDTLFNYSLAKIKKSNIGLYLAISDTIYITVFVAFLMTN